jgi:phosphoglycolate phosphatase-like HAD superfamily hydrolase
MLKRIVIFDLDETVVDSAHRTPNHADGTLNLPLYLQLKTRENTLRDGLLPLATFWRSLDLSETYVIVCTARTWADFDQEFLDMHGLRAHKIIARFTPAQCKMRDPELKGRGLRKLFSLRQFRNLPKYMFDDAKPVISAMRELGIVCLNSHKVNRRLSA